MTISTYLADVWSVTDFRDPELAEYAESQLRRDTRYGIQTMAGLSLAMQLGILLLTLSQGGDSKYLYIGVLLALLSLHILISAHFVADIHALHALGVAFFVVGALAVTILAHRFGNLSMGMMAAIVMLIVAVPLVPWAVRESITVIGLTCVLLITSLVSVPGRFEAGSLMELQALLLGAAVVVIIVTGRNTFIRKHDIRARFELEKAHREMELLSKQDHLTGAWNRRYLDSHFAEFAREGAREGRPVQIAVLDIDNFKGINDEFGHHVGDQILINVAKTFIKLLSGRGWLTRLGGDEFLITYHGDGLEEIIAAAISQLQQGTVRAELSEHHSVTLSTGIACAQPGQLANLETLFRTADKALYAAKRDRSSPRTPDTTLFRTGTWNL